MGVRRAVAPARHPGPAAPGLLVIAAAVAAASCCRLRLPRGQMGGAHLDERGGGRGVWHRQNGHVRTPMTYAAGLALAATALLGVAGCGQPEPTPPDEGTVSVPIQPTITPLQTEPESVGTTAAGTADSSTSASCSRRPRATSRAACGASGDAHELRRRGAHVTVAIFLVTSADADAAHGPGGRPPRPGRRDRAGRGASFYTDQDATRPVECLSGVTDKGQ